MTYVEQLKREHRRQIEAVKVYILNMEFHVHQMEAENCRLRSELKKTTHNLQQVSSPLTEQDASQNA